MKVIRAKSAGFCWGVERAIQVAREEAQGGKRKVYTDGPLIHNRQMMELLGQVVQTYLLRENVLLPLIV